MTGPQLRVVVGDGVDLAVTEWGSADAGRPTVLLVHGYPDTSGVWEPVAELLAGRYHVVAYDVRGAGASSAPHETEAYRLEHLVEDMAAVADTTCPDHPVHLVGHDWGSIQGWEAVSSERLAGRLASFTSLFAPGLDHAAAWAAARLRHPTPEHLQQLLGQQLKSWYIVAFHLPGATLAWRSGLGRRWGQIQHKVEGVPASSSYPAATVAADGAQGVALYRANFGRRLARPDPRPTTVPVQVLVATEDHFVSPAMSDGLGRWVPQLWRSEVVAGHWLPRTHPELVARYVSEFVDHIEGGPESPRLGRDRQPAAAGADPPSPWGHPTATSGRRRRRREDPSGPHQRGRVVVVTGAGAGIGRATAVAFARQGATVVIIDLDGDAAATTAALVRSAGGQGHSCPVDVADADAMEGLAKWVEHTLGAPDVVVNNAGIGMAGPLLDTSVADWEQVLGVNVWGVIHGSRLFGRLMADGRRGGHIVNVASAAAFLPNRSYPAYATPKAAVLMLSQCLEAELAAAGVAVHTICPSMVDTGIAATTRHVGVGAHEQERRRRALAGLYRRRGLKAEQVADAILHSVQRGRSAVVPVGTEARFGRVLSRLSPAASRRLARIDLVPRMT
jgi:NAD(P)-dependent dehydrogenase (short-subunit alcohol dehydrogenase family)/pimeloyl-ACP methyl ester carboxylesterase